MWLGAPLRRLALLLSFRLHPLYLVRPLLLLFLLFSAAELGLWTWLYHNPLGDSLHGRWQTERVRPIVLDHGGRLIGLWPVTRGQGSAASPYAAAAAGELPSHWWPLVVSLEDANRDRWYHLFGVDFSQLFKWPVRALLGRPNSGGSTLEMQLVKTLHTDTDVRGLRRLLRKLRDYVFAPAVWLQHNERDLARQVATHFPLLTSGPHGLETASWLLFDRPARALDLAQQALLAAAIKYRIDINAYDEAGWQRAQARWRKAVARATYGLRQLHRSGRLESAKMEAAVRELRRMRLPDLAPPEGVQSCLGHRARRQQDLAARKLDDRARFLARGELLQAAAELSPWLGSDWLADAVRVRLGVDLEANCRTKWAIDAARARWLQRLGLAGEDAYVVLAVADGEGRLVRFHAETAYPRYLPFRLSGRGRAYMLGEDVEDVRTLGSIGKVFAALLLGEEGDTPSTPYYRLRRERLVGRYPYQRRIPYRNADGYTGALSPHAPGARIAARLAFARSDNLALMERLSRVEGLPARSRALLESFGLSPPADFQPVVDLPLGRLHGAPRQAQGIFAMLGPEAGPLACRPVIVEHIEAAPGREDSFRGALARRAQARRRICERARAWLAARPAAARFARQVLAGVLDPALHGTAAAHLARFRQGGPLGLEYSVAKTGTLSLDSRGHGVRWVWLAGALQAPDGSLYSYVAQAGPLGSKGLGIHAAGGQLGALLAPVLQSLPGMPGGGEQR